MSNDATKNLSELAEVFKALGHPTRLWIVRNLAKGEMCVCDFVEGTDEEFSSVSQHLNVLKKAICRGIAVVVLYGFISLTAISGNENTLSKRA